MVSVVAPNTFRNDKQTHFEANWDATMFFSLSGYCQSPEGQKDFSMLLGFGATSSWPYSRHVRLGFKPILVRFSLAILTSGQPAISQTIFLFAVS